MPTYPIYGDQDLAYLRSLEDERFKITGQDSVYYSLGRGSNVDPLYNEPTSPLYTSYSIKVAVNFQEVDDKTPSVQDEGFTVESDGKAFVSFSEWSLNGPPTRKPKEGDVVYLMERYFDVVKASTGGNVVDSPRVVGYALDLKIRSRFDPQRRL